MDAHGIATRDILPNATFATKIVTDYKFGMSSISDNAPQRMIRKNARKPMQNVGWQLKNLGNALSYHARLTYP
jgi:hypothetical protein